VTPTNSRRVRVYAPQRARARFPVLVNWFVPLFVGVLAIGFLTTLTPRADRPYLFVLLSCFLLVAFCWRLWRISVAVDSNTGELTVANLLRTYHLQPATITGVAAGTYLVAGRYGGSTKFDCAVLSYGNRPHPDDRSVRIMATIGSADDGELMHFLKEFCASRSIPCTL